MVANIKLAGMERRVRCARRRARNDMCVRLHAAVDYADTHVRDSPMDGVRVRVCACVLMARWCGAHMGVINMRSVVCALRVFVCVKSQHVCCAIRV